MLVFLLVATSLLPAVPQGSSAPDHFAPLAIYSGTWTIDAEHPWSGAAAGTADHLLSHCTHFTAYFACEQTVNGSPASLIVYTSGDSVGHLHTRIINPQGLAGGRGDLRLDGNHWTYLDKPPATLKGNWSRTENYILDHDHIRFEEFESADEGKTWTKTNSGTETRVS
jgi:hypothetical protein